MNSSTDLHETEQEPWQFVEAFFTELHDLSRAPVSRETFYRELLAGSVASLAATGGAVWQRRSEGEWEVVQQLNLDEHLHRDGPEADGVHGSLLRKAASAEDPLVIGSASLLSGVASTIALGAVRPHGPSAPSDDTPQPVTVVELFLREARPETQSGWKEFLATVCHIASNFHLELEVLRLRSSQPASAEILSLVRRIHGPLESDAVGFEVANIGREFLGADRVSVLLRRGRRWRLLATSGVDRIAPQADAVKRLEQIARVTADWSEPVEYAEKPRGDDPHCSPPLDSLPTAVESAIAQHVDDSLVRRLISVPLGIAPAPSDENETVRKLDTATSVIIAESFSASTNQLTLRRTLEFADLCEPALRRAAQLDDFPVRTALRWSNRWRKLVDSWGMGRVSAAIAVVLLVVAGLVMVPMDFEISARARLVPLVEREVFSTAQGTVAEIYVEHGDRIAAGDRLALLHDPQLALETERVLGELETARTRLEAIAVTRTDRQAREEIQRDGMPLSAEAKQLELRLANLERQREILAERREALTLRSPIAGTVQTLDVQHLLRTRPVDRGQVLFTVADTTSGWKLHAEIPQDQVGHVVAAQQQVEGRLPVRFRLAGNVREVYHGELEALSGVAVLDTMALEELPHLRADVAVNDSELSAARPGMDAEVRIGCGRRSVGYVWLHSVWENLVRWVVF